MYNCIISLSSARDDIILISCYPRLKHRQVILDTCHSYETLPYIFCCTSNNERENRQCVCVSV